MQAGKNNRTRSNTVEGIQYLGDTICFLVYINRHTRGETEGMYSGGCISREWIEYGA